MPKQVARSVLRHSITIAEWEFNTMLSLVFVVGVIAGGFFSLSSFFPSIFAAGDVSTVWDFSVPGDYILSDANQIEVSGNQASLKVRNYASDANTAMLLHLDESSGTTAEDSSSNNNDATSVSGTWVTGNLNGGLSLNGVNENARVPDSASLSLSQSNTLEAWTKFDEVFGVATHSQRQGVLDKGEYQLYYDNETGKIVYEIADAAATTWTQVGGANLNGGWGTDGQRDTESMTVMDSDVYVGLGDGTGDAEVWKWDGLAWEKIGGDAINNSWAINTFESVFSLINDGTNIYAGLGATSGDGEIWKWNGTTWTKIAGDAQYNSWPVNRNEGVYTMLYQNSTLYAGLGISTDDAEVWACSTCANGTPDWTQIGGDNGNAGINGSWTGLDNMDAVYSLVGDGTNVYAGTGVSASDAEVWMWDGGSWTKIGGDSVNGSWGAGYEYVLSMVYSGSSLYAGLGTTANDAEVWRYTGGSWTQIGGDNLNGGWATNYEGVYRMVTDGTDIYVGLGLTAGENEVWQCSSCATSPAWTKIGGDAVDGSFTNTHTVVNDLFYADSTLYAGIQTTSNQYSSQVWTYRTTDSPKWTQIAGNYVNKSWGFRGLNDVEVMNVSGDKLYAGTGYQYIGNALVWEFDGDVWTLIGGQGINSSWDNNTYERVSSMISHQGELYVGLGVSANDGEVWHWNGLAWEQIGGDSLNSGWGANYEEVTALSSYKGYLFAGLGNSNGDSEVWRWDGSDWAKVGGDGVFGGWGSGIEQVLSISPYNGKLYAGTGNGNGDAELYECAGCETLTPAWTKVGGDGVLSSWNASPVDFYNNVDSLIVYDGQLIVGLGTASGEAAVYAYDGNSTTWSQIGGDDINGSWANGTFERVRTTVVYNGDLYAGLGNTTGDGEVWRYDGIDWEQVGGDGLNSGWTSSIEEINAYSVFEGKLYTGTGNSVNSDAAVWAYGNNAVLTSATVGQDTDWHHIAASYDGLSMKIYIDGVMDNSLAVTRSMPDSSRDLLIGTTYAGREFGKPQGYFQGSLDEIRISNVARSTFVTTPYAASAQTVRPATAVMTTDVKNWEDFNETLPGSPVGTITYRLSANSGATWLYWNGSSWASSSSTAQANDVSTVTANIDTFTIGSGGVMWQAILLGDGTEQVILEEVEITATSDTTDPTPPDTLTALSQSGGDPISTDTWYQYSAPYFSWSGATDIGGSGVAGYFVYFGTDDSADPQTAGTFQAGATYTASSLISGQTYYLRIRSQDVAQNVSTIWDAFTYKFDMTPPNNPSGLSVSPSGYSGVNEFTFFWSTVGTDIGSGLAGYQYKTGAPAGMFSDWSTTITETSITLPEVAYQENENIFLLRTVDNAGNVAGTTVQVSFYYAGEAPTAPRNLSVSPTVNDTNLFSFNWDPPETFSGTQNELRYCYTVNTLPTNATCTFTAAGVTALPADAYANQPGENTMYVVARDNVGNINYGTYDSVVFAANTPSPGLPLNVEIADVSVKSTESWKLALSWEPPAGSGDEIASYQIYFSTDEITFDLASSTNGIAYIGTGLEQTTYYYKVRACDSANNCGAFTESVSMYPDGRFTEPAALVDGPVTSDVSTRTARITWVTDRDSDSKIAYGLASGDYFESEPSVSTPSISHEIILEGLDPGQRYFYVAKWTDEDGNTGVSEEKTFETTPSPSIQAVSVGSVSLNSALIQFTTTNAAQVTIDYGIGASLSSSTTIETSLAQSSYTAVLDNLQDGTAYNFRINPIDADGFEYEGTVFEFTTLPRPKVSNIRVQEVRGTAQPTVLVTWETNVETNSLISYFPTNNPAAQTDQIDVIRIAGEHRMVISNLLNQTQYTLYIKGTDVNGNEAVSDPQIITTALDTRPPKITNVQVETSLVQSSGNQQQTAQIVVSWDTDEPATSQVEFAEGTGTTYTQRTQQDVNLTTNHLVVISGLDPSKVYHLRALSADSVNNVTASFDTVTITPKATSTAFDLVISNLQQIFGFLAGLSF